MSLVERKEIVVKREDTDDRMRVSVSEGATFDSLRKALRVNNNDGLDGRDVSGYRFNIGGKVLSIHFEPTTLLWSSQSYLILLETFSGEASDDTRELKVHASRELKAIIKVKKYDTLAHVRRSVDACFHENAFNHEYLFKLYDEVVPKEEEVSIVVWAIYYAHFELVSSIGVSTGSIVGEKFCSNIYYFVIFC